MKILENISDDSSKLNEAILLEQEHVHKVYHTIAIHFATTRRRPWLTVKNFILKQPIGSIGLDIGCGNGRHLNLRSDIFILGIDRCDTFMKLISDTSNVLIGDALSLPIRPIFDFCLSIAVIHHFATNARRIAALRELLAVLRPGGVALIIVWALEQKDLRKKWNIYDSQNALIPWHLPQTNNTQQKPTQVDRYYYLFRYGELEQCIEAAGGIVIASGSEQYNWWAQMKKPEN
ncbi:hypothetical protein PCANB_001428 [Pneumocystis canis]|nr:hypothetical protein PCK1_001594 [Pneumocystis canis]KAG5439129.1 hypothetical protein PCANB_001428 [Pneumocystis canis]